MITNALRNDKIVGIEKYIKKKKSEQEKQSSPKASM